jgi:hypothetical protein
MRSLAHPHTWLFVILSCANIGAIVFLSQFLSWSVMMILFVAVIFFFACIVRPPWATYALAFFAPMSGIVIDFTRDQSLARLPYIGGIHAPFVDFLAIGILIIILVLILIRPEVVRVQGALKLGYVLGAFFFIAALSTMCADPLFFGTTAKAFFRSYLFFYLAFAVPMIVLLHTRFETLRALFAYECAVMIGAMMGAVSLITQKSVGFARAMPFSIFGFAPFGVNHNVLAESLTAIIPFAWWFAFKQAEENSNVIFSRRNILTFFAGFISLVALLTFSRAAWIVMTMQLCVFLWWRGGKRARGIIVATVAALAIFFLVIQSTVIADSSDATRKDLLGIAILYGQRAPWIGNGPGMFVPIVSETTAFRMDYGEPMDAHGVLQKLFLEVGILGVVIFFLYIGFIVRALWMRRENSSFHAMLFVTVISLWGYQLFNTGYFDGKVWVLMGISLASLYYEKKRISHSS